MTGRPRTHHSRKDRDMAELARSRFRGKSATNQFQHAPAPGTVDSLRYVVHALTWVAITYAFVAGFHTVHDYDIGWQLATGRWLLQHHRVLSTEVFSYTAFGKNWIYPVLSGVTFYILYLFGGYSALTWLTATASAATTFFLTRQSNALTAILAIIAVPVIALRLAPRADLFTTVLFAAVLGLLWNYHRTGKGHLWLLPLLLFLWVNLHWGFVTGLGLCAAYLLLEAGDLLNAAKRSAAKERLRKAWPWLLASVFTTLLNPWGPRLYLEMVGWGKGLVSEPVISEFAPLRLNLYSVQQSLLWRNPDMSAIWWLLVAACIATVIAVAYRDWAGAILLAGSAAAAIERYRFGAMFACVLVVVGGGVLGERLDAWLAPILKKSTPQSGAIAIRVLFGLCGCFAILAGVGIYDLSSNRYYLNNEPSVFGTGLSWWYPERALAFVEKEHLPGNIFNNSVLGGYLAWRVPEYPIFIDSRRRPFTGEVAVTDAELPAESPESPSWARAIQQWGINTIVVSTGRITGFEYFPRLREFCESQTWRPVYLDEVSAVFLRNSPENRALIDRLQVDCKTARFLPPIATTASNRGRADLFNFWTNSGFMLVILGRTEEALAALDKAEEIYADSAHLHFQRGGVLAVAGKLQQSETELHKAIELEPDDSSWLLLSQVLTAEQRYDDAMEALRTAAETALQPQFLYLQLGKLEAQAGHGQEALAALDRSAQFYGTPDVLTASSAGFVADIEETRAKIWYETGDTRRALEFEEKAVHLTPTDARRLKELANLYQALGRTSEAQQALSQIKP